MQAYESIGGGLRGKYQRRMLEIRGAFEAGASGAVTIAARAAALDELVTGLWQRSVGQDARLGTGVALVAVGGYGRRELFPYSDVDLLFLLDGRLAEKDLKVAIRQVNQEMWDCGIRVAPVTRKLAVGDAGLYDKLVAQCIPKLLQRDQKAVMARLLELTRARHAKYGDTLFHLEPNIKDCPGGLRDVHVCGWMTALRGVGAEKNGLVGASANGAEAGNGNEFRKAVEFLWLVRCFLHYRHERDDNTLDWQAQDAAAEAAVGLVGRRPKKADAAYWMRVYFRHARSVERRVMQMLEEAPAAKGSPKLLSLKRDRRAEVEQQGFRVERGRVVLDAVTVSGGHGEDPAQDPDVVLKVFEGMRCRCCLRILKRGRRCGITCRVC
jgi:[protein-PII] uridylyltransferase